MVEYELGISVMIDFGDLGAFAEHALQIAENLAVHHALDKAAKVVQDAAKDKLGEYQEAAGPFWEWNELEPATIAQHNRLGVGESPLLVTGELYASIERKVDGMTAHIGSDNPIAEYQELGTKNIPPRSFLGGAAFESVDEVVKIIGEDIAIALAGTKDGINIL